LYSQNSSENPEAVSPPKTKSLVPSDVIACPVLALGKVPDMFAFKKAHVLAIVSYRQRSLARLFVVCPVCPPKTNNLVPTDAIACPHLARGDELDKFAFKKAHVLSVVSYCQRSFAMPAAVCPPKR